MASPDIGMAVVFYDRRRPDGALLAMNALVNDRLGRGHAKMAPKTHDGSIILQLMGTQETFHGGDVALKFLARLCDSRSGSTFYGDARDPRQATHIDQFVSLAYSGKEFDEAALAALNEHLDARQFLVGDQLTIADVAVWAVLSGSKTWLGYAAKAAAATKTHMNLFRWFSMCQYQEQFEDAKQKLAAVVAEAAAAKEQKMEEKKGGAGGKAASKKAETGGSYDIDLPGAAMGKVKTRFPPEPSGYLHIGHVKACLLNDYFAQHYKGKLLLRFDDTNPSKEKQDFVDNIIQDLKTLEVEYHEVSYTSNHFQMIMDHATDLVKRGLAYVDDTPNEEMKAMRMERTPYAHRDSCGADACKNTTCPHAAEAVQRNMKLWEEMKAGTDHGLQCALRVKMDMSSDNGCLRDPVIYRCNLTPHHRTGTTWKVYPIYDFACPIVDSFEGVTHALRTQEYRDRNVQYAKMLEMMNLRWVHIWDFSRLNMKYTLMSKRKLQKLVDAGAVDGWFDPRFPTVQGLIRRGLRVKALKEFIRVQGASRNDGLMEWDKIWTINKRILDKECHRFVAVAKDPKAVLTLQGQGDEVLQAALHPKDPDMGHKKVLLSQQVLLEVDDARLCAVGEEVTLLTLGNVILDKIDTNSDGSMTLVGRRNPSGSVKTTKKKLHWVAAGTEAKAQGESFPHVKTLAVEFDHLISVEKLEENMQLEDVLRPKTRFETVLVGESALKSVQKGQCVQLQRRGFFRCDQAYESDDKPLVLFYIPDGHTKAMSTVSSKVDKGKAGNV